MRRGLSGVVGVSVVLLASSLVLRSTLLAQHGGFTGPGSSGHAGGAAHAGSAPSFATPSRSSPGLSSPATHWPSSQAGQLRHWPNGNHGNPAHPTDGERNGRNRQHYPFVYAGYPWLSYGYGVPLAYGLPYGGDPDDTSPVSQQQADEPPLDYGPQVAANTVPSFRPPYQGQIQGQLQAALVHPQPTTTLIFKDGRSPQQVHNYALTPSTLYALDGDARQEIPLTLLNVPATVEANRAAGVDFALPVTR